MSAVLVMICAFYLLLGTGQGSVLFLVSPLFDIVPLLFFADDSYDVKQTETRAN
jgi:hypothetical protein